MSLSLNGRIISKNLLKAEPILDPDYFALTTDRENATQALSLGQDVVSTGVGEYMEDIFKQGCDRINTELKKQWVGGEGFKGLLNHEAMRVMFMESMRKNGGDTSNLTVDRINAIGSEFFVRQITSVVPDLILKPTRGISYPFMPLRSLGDTNENLVTQGYTWDGKFKLVNNESNDIPAVRVQAQDIKQPNFQYISGVQFNQRELSNIMALSTINSQTADHIGQSKVIAATYSAMRSIYTVLLDDIAWNGDDNDKGFGTYVKFFDDGAVDTSKATSVTTGTAPNGVGFYSPDITVTDYKSLAVDDKINLLSGIVAAVSSNSSNAFQADTLFMDLVSFNATMNLVRTFADTNPLQWIKENFGVLGIIPVPAWSAKFPTKTTIMAAQNDSQVYFFNISRPLSAWIPQFVGLSTNIPYYFYTTGIDILQAKGLIEYQTDLAP